MIDNTGRKYFLYEFQRLMNCLELQRGQVVLRYKEKEIYVNNEKRRTLIK